MINWLNKLFNRQLVYQPDQPEPKQIFLSWHDFYYGRREMKSFEVRSSQSGLYIEKDKDIIFLHEKGELYPAPYDKGREEFKAKWWPKSGWGSESLYLLKMITEQEKTDKEAQVMIKTLETK